jgi:hypothetical protein
VDSATPLAGTGLVNKETLQRCDRVGIATVETLVRRLLEDLEGTSRILECTEDAGYQLLVDASTRLPVASRDRLVEQDSASGVPAGAPLFVAEFQLQTQGYGADMPTLAWVEAQLPSGIRVDRRVKPWSTAPETWEYTTMPITAGDVDRLRQAELLPVTEVRPFTGHPRRSDGPFTARLVMDIADGDPEAPYGEWLNSGLPWGIEIDRTKQQGRLSTGSWLVWTEPITTGELRQLRASGAVRRVDMVLPVAERQLA